MKAINDLNRHTIPLQQELEQAVTRVIASGWFVLGSEVKEFEQEFAAYNGIEHCISLANGTDALELSLRALNIGPGSRVLTVANAGMYSTTAILAAGATPVYAEVTPSTGLIDPNDVLRQLEAMPIDAIIVTHLYGLLADISQIINLAASKNIPVIEDCAQAHGAVLAGQKAGTFGNIGCFSFYPTKNLGALGDGGAAITNDPDLANRLRQLRQYGWEAKYQATLSGGRNSRLDEMQAAVLRVKLPLLDSWNRRRREIARRYAEGVQNKNITSLATDGEAYVAHLYVIKTSTRDNLRRYLAQAGIPTDVHYPVPDYRQPGYAHLFPHVNKPVTEQLCAQVVTLPCFPEMADAEVDMIIDSINRWQP